MGFGEVTVSELTDSNKKIADRNAIAPIK